MPVETVKGGCHCGAVRFEADVDLSRTVTCNCSICSLSAAVMTFVPENRFRLLSGQEVLSDYQFNKNVIHHYFCQKCGVRSFARGSAPDGTPTYAIHVRCLENVSLEGLTPVFFDGKSR
jgi:hypothetical protein